MSKKLLLLLISLMFIGCSACEEEDSWGSGWRSARTDDANGFRIGTHEYHLYPPVDSVVVTNNVMYSRSAEIVDRSWGDICKDEYKYIKTFAIIDTSYYENTEYGSYNVWYCDTSFSVDAKDRDDVLYYGSYHTPYPYVESQFKHCDSITRDCKTEIKMKIDTIWKELE